MTKQSTRKWKIIGLVILGFVLGGFLTYQHIKPPSQVKQLNMLQQRATQEAYSLTSGNYTKEKAGSTCWDYWVSGKGSFKRRSCTYGFGIHTSIPKDKIVRKALSKGWEKKVYNNGTSIEWTSYSISSGACTIDDISGRDSLSREVNNYYTVSCQNDFNETLF